MEIRTPMPARQESLKRSPGEAHSSENVQLCWAVPRIMPRLSTSRMWRNHIKPEEASKGQGYSVQCTSAVFTGSGELLVPPNQCWKSIIYEHKECFIYNPPPQYKIPKNTPHPTTTAKKTHSVRHPVKSYQTFKEAEKHCTKHQQLGANPATCMFQSSLEAHVCLEYILLPCLASFVILKKSLESPEKRVPQLREFPL